MEIRAAQACDLCIDIGMNATVQQRVIAEVDSRHDVGGAKGDLLRFGEEIVGIAVEHHPPNRFHGNQFFRNELGGIQDIEAEFLGVCFRKYLHAQFPFGIVARLDRFPEVATVKVRVCAHDFHRFVPDQGVRSQTAVSNETCRRSICPGHSPAERCAPQNPASCDSFAGSPGPT